MVKITPSNVKKVLGGGANVIAALGTISGVVGNQVKQSLEDHHEHHKDDFPLPDLREVPLADAQQVLTNNELLWSLLPVAPAIKYAGAQPNVVLATAPKPRAKIAPQGFVKVYYATPETVAASAELLAAQATQRQAKKAARQATTHRRLQAVTTGVKQVPKGAKQLIGKVPLRRHQPQPPDPTSPAESEPK
ncbi:hypothetical protein [Lacticaseibacillus nasuensis]|uniref:hypothetical protein n=1 Tax=Lacticaseibacillus nasuensis TaxID=944671 RepID=UPI002246D1B4|nr:hypothetical protein [Lacticaseibacillus nasuensis]MCX2455253.1 hypothetical protein [Lacticaseibacillus nasuensis]